MKKIKKIITALITSVLFLMPINVFAAGNPYYGGYSNCTWTAWELAYAATGVAMPNFGNAGNWINAASWNGFRTGREPAPNSIIVWSGHVAFVASVDYAAGTVYVKEGGYLGHYNERVVSAYAGSGGRALLGYIYLDGGSWQDYSHAAYSPGTIQSIGQSGSVQGIPRNTPRPTAAPTSKTSQSELIKDSNAVVSLGDGISIKDKAVDVESIKTDVIFVDDITKPETVSKNKTVAGSSASKEKEDEIVISEDVSESNNEDTDDKSLNVSSLNDGSVIEIISLTPEARKAAK